MILLSFPASGQTLFCGPSDEFKETLADKYGEFPQRVYMTLGESLVEFVVSENGSWTMLLTRPDGMSCVIGAGGEWWDVETTGPGL